MILTFEDGGRSHIMGAIDNTYRKNNSKSIWWATNSLFNVLSDNFEISKQQIDDLKKEVGILKTF